MFTGIIEAVGTVKSVISNGSNLILIISSPISADLRPDQSLSHNGVCLTVEEAKGGEHRVTAIAETLKKTTLGSWKAGDTINLERCLQLSSRIDGHFVQGHVDCIAKCKKVISKDGSMELTFRYSKKFAGQVIEKGSIAVNGISLTAFNVTKNSFTVAIIPYTREHTNLGSIKAGNEVNLEFDLLGKYILRKLSLKK
jgi:riboflavin synthase